MSSFLVAAGLSMTFVGGAATITMSSLGYQHGFAALVDPVSVFIGLCVSALLVSKYRKDQSVTITESLAGTSGPLLWLVSIVSVLFYLLLTAANIVAFTKLTEPFLPISSVLISLGGTIIVASYTLKSGIMGVTRTDAVQLFAVLALFVAPCFYIITASDPAGAAPRSLEAIDASTAIILSFTLLLCPVLQDVKVRAQAARSSREAVVGILCAAFLYALIVGTAVATGRDLALSGIAVPDPENVLSFAFTRYFGEFGIIFVIGVLAAILSTMDGFAFAAITTAQAIPIPALSSRRATLYLGAIVFAIALVIAIAFQVILSLILLALLLYVSLLVPIALGRHLNVSDERLLACAIIFSGVAVVIFFAGWEPIPHAVIFPTLHVMLVFAARALPDRKVDRNT